MILALGLSSQHLRACCMLDRNVNKTLSPRPLAVGLPAHGQLSGLGDDLSFENEITAVLSGGHALRPAVEGWVTCASLVPWTSPSTSVFVSATLRSDLRSGQWFGCYYCYERRKTCLTLPPMSGKLCGL